MFLNDMQQLIRREFGKDDDRVFGEGAVCACRPTVSGLDAQLGVACAGRSNCGECACSADDKMKVCGFGVESGILAAVYAPLSRFEGVYDPDTAIRRGTMFEGLDKPFYGGGKGVDCRGNEK